MSIACKVRPIGGEALLPDGYRRCEYLESTGAQYIVTNEFKPDYIEAEFVFQFTQIKGVRQLFGLSSASPYFGINAAGNWDKLNTPADLDIHRLTMAMNRQSGEYYTILDDTRKDGEAGDWWNPETVRWICNPFALDITGSFPCCIRNYGVKVTGDNNLLCNLIPCLDDKGKPCMFDTVSRTPYYNYNNGSGDFLYKLKTPITRKLPRGYQPLDYLESTGTQYIDTGFVATKNTGLYAEWMFNGQGENHQNQHVLSCVNMYCSRPRIVDNIWVAQGVLGVTNSTNFELTLGKKNIVSTNFKNSKTIDFNETSVKVDEAVGSVQGEVILCGYSDLNTSYLFYGRVYSAKISEGIEIVRDFIPCLDPTGKPCMWDYVTRRPFYNQDITGPDFLYG